MIIDYTKDYIFQCYSKKEQYIRKKVNDLNNTLQCKGVKLSVNIADCFSKEDLYGQGSEVLLTETLLTKTQYITKPIYQFNESIYGIYYMPEYNWNIEISKLLSCFINRIDPIRQFFAYKIFSLELDKDAWLSFIGDNREEMSCLEYYDSIHKTFYFPHYQDVYLKIRSQMPFKNFLDTGNLCDVILQSKVNLVIETYHERTDSVTFSEKIFRSLQTPRPWLLLGSTGSIRRLRSMGFYVYDDFVDNGYDDHDTSENVEERFNAIFDRLQDLKNLSVTSSILEYWKDKTKHNRQILEEWNKIWKDQADAVIDAALVEAEKMISDSGD